MTAIRMGLAAMLAMVGALAGAVQPAFAAKGDGSFMVAGLFGESDEEKAARLAAEQRERDQDAGIVELRQRVGDLERALQQVTGQNEVLTHRIRELQSAFDRQRKDFDYKLCVLTAQLMGVSADAEGGGINCSPSGAGGSSLAPLALQPDDPALAVRKEYDAAMALLARAQYDESRAAFTAFIEAHPKDDMVQHALYFLGNIAYVQKDYAGAAKAFAQGIRDFPKGPRAPDSMFKLGQTLIALGQTKQGCLTFGAIKKKYPNAPAALIERISRAYDASCK